jgi:hypothetical protein
VVQQQRHADQQQQLHLQPWQRQRLASQGCSMAAGAPPEAPPAGVAAAAAAPAAGKAKASHVSLAQLLTAPAAADSRPPSACGQAQAVAPRPQQASVLAESPVQLSSGAKRGREALGASRPASGKRQQGFWAALDDACTHCGAGAVQLPEPSPN